MENSEIFYFCGTRKSILSEKIFSRKGAKIAKRKFERIIRFRCCRSYAMTSKINQIVTKNTEKKLTPK